VKELVAAAKELRRGQRDVLSGKGRDRLETAMRSQRDALHELLGAAREILEEAGKPASTDTLTRISNTLRGASGADSSAKELAAGRLTEEIEETGFGPLLHGVPAPAKAPSPAKRRTEERKAELAELRERLREAKAALKEAQRDAKRAQREADDAAAEAEEAERTVAGLELDLKRRSR
jgi:DNA repair exonuclease SbcCD ATPase subunit